jgi:hypothetical protein
MKTSVLMAGVTECSDIMLRSDDPGMVDFRKTIRIQTAIHQITSDGRNFCQFLPRRRFKTPDSTQRLICMRPNCKNAWSIFRRRKRRWPKHRATVRDRAINSRRSSAPAPARSRYVQFVDGAAQHFCPRVAIATLKGRVDIDKPALS